MVSIQFVDDDITGLPVVGVNAVSANITEGTDNNASFNLIVTPADTPSLSIRYEIIVAGNYLQDQDNKVGEFTEAITFVSGAYMVNLPIDDDDTSEPRGTITLKLLYETANLTYQIDANNNSAEIIITDNNGGETLPQINISAEDSIVEGEEIIFVLTATMSNTPLTTDLPIVLSITQTGSFLTIDAGDRDVRIENGTARHPEQTIWLENRASSGTITAEVKHDSSEDPAYSRGVEFRKVVMVELFTGPTVSINALTSSIVAGIPAVFDVSVSTPNETSATDVLINVAQTHDVIQWRIPSGVSIPAGQNSRQLQIPTRKNMELPEDMEVSITITFRESSDYRFRADSEASVMVNRSDYR